MPSYTDTTFVTKSFSENTIGIPAFMERTTTTQITSVATSVVTVSASVPTNADNAADGVDGELRVIILTVTEKETVTTTVVSTTTVVTTDTPKL